jgi:GNAT superfamily N-acetyltransferase
VTASIHIRAAVRADALSLARLSDQLGYPADEETIARRLQDVLGRRAGAVMVAEIDGKVAGWAHVLPQRRLEHDANAELAGLVVDEPARGSGIGRALLHAAEAWAGEQGYPELVVRSNVIRERAHRFYLREGYAEKKRQVVFTKRTA